MIGPWTVVRGAGKILEEEKVEGRLLERSKRADAKEVDCNATLW